VQAFGQGNTRSLPVTQRAFKLIPVAPGPLRPVRGPGWGTPKSGHMACAPHAWGTNLECPFLESDAPFAPMAFGPCFEMSSGIGIYIGRVSDLYTSVAISHQLICTLK
jgi:hypothetical protein